MRPSLPPLLWNLSPHHLLRCKYHAVVSPQTAKSYCYTVMWKSRQSRLASRLRSYGETHQGIKTFNKIANSFPQDPTYLTRIKEHNLPCPSLEKHPNNWELFLPEFDCYTIFFSYMRSGKMKMWLVSDTKSQPFQPEREAQSSPLSLSKKKLTQCRSSSVRVAQHS